MSKYLNEAPPTSGERLLDRFRSFGIDLIEPTANGVWFEQRLTRAGKPMKSIKLCFVTITDLNALVREVDALQLAKREEEGFRYGVD